MESLTTNITFNEEFYKSPYAEVDELPLMTRPKTVLMIVLLYLAFVLKIGPAYMKNRPPLELKNTMLVYNFIQVVLSAYLVYRHFRYGILEWGLFSRKCYMNEDTSRNEAIFALWVYFAAKISELLDTVFFVLRKKDNQVTFLHVYHHTGMVLVPWGILKYSPSHIYAYMCFMNSLVHVFMYAYYGLSGLGKSVVKYLWWKQYLTSFQIVQFVSILLYYSLAVTVSDCPPSKGLIAIVMFNIFLLLVLFSNFYKQSYVNTKKTN